VKVMPLLFGITTRRRTFNHKHTVPTQAAARLLPAKNRGAVNGRQDTQ